MQSFTKLRSSVVLRFGSRVIGNKCSLPKVPTSPLNLFECSDSCNEIKIINTRSYCEASTIEAEGNSDKIIDPSKDRSKVIPVEVSIKYLQSSAYKTTYGDDPVWKHYRRNHKGQLPPRKTRKTCIRSNVIATGNPCPICRDEYLVVHPTNTDLLKQFISPHTGEVLSYELTGVCQNRHLELLVAIIQAKDMGLITFDLPFQKYDYSEYVDLRQVQ